MLEMFWYIKINSWKKILLHPGGFEPLNLLCIDPHESQAVFYYCNTAETVYDGTVELYFVYWIV